MSETRPPLPPFNLETAIQKVRMAENAWNARDPRRVASINDVEIGEADRLFRSPAGPRPEDHPGLAELDL